jgi:hypothetical protein
MLNGKIYGGITQALDTIDEALLLCGREPLAKIYNDDIMFDVKKGPDHSRIRLHRPGGIC